ncbi:MAG: tetratricopeptide repeat protein [Myxococcales bacterium]|nr:tetratricopeptide repeat protein [Myxococcales bacterium]
MIWALALALACRDAEFAPLRGALDEYGRGREAFEAGNHPEAIAAFVKAREGDPGSAVLMLWEARARAASGDVAGAEALATQVVTAHPEAGLAWYNRAAWRVRLGHPDAAAEDLERALATGIRSPYEAAIDTDFSTVLGTAPFEDVLPPTPVVVRVVPPQGSVFVGSEVLIQAQLLSAPTLVASLRRTGPSPGCLVLDRVVEDQHTGEGVLARRIDLYFRAVGSCDVELNVLAEASSPVRATVPLPPVRVLVEAPSRFIPPPPRDLPVDLPLPGTLATADGAWAAGRTGSTVWAIGRADQAPTFVGRPPDIKLELRVDGTTRAGGGAWLAAWEGEVLAGGWTAVVAARPD